MIRTADLFPGHRTPRASGQLGEGLRYVRERPQLLVTMVMVFMVGTFGFNFQITLALIAKQVFHTGAGSFGLLTSAFAAGSLLGALTSARRKGLPRARTMLLSVLVFGLLEIAVGLSPSFGVMALVLVPTGIAALLFSTTANSLVQLGSEPRVRGRVMALYILVFMGGTPIGAPLIGLLAETFGPRSSLLVGGGVCALSALAGALWMARSTGLVLEPHLVRRRPHVHVRPYQA